MAELIVSLDVVERKKLEEVVARVGDMVDFFKVGMVPFLQFGTPLIKYLHDRGKKVFLDLKFHDIPNTVEMATQIACSMNVAMLNVHLLGGEEMLERAVRARDSTGASTLLVGVTLLTSLSRQDILGIGFTRDIQDQIALLAELAYSHRLNGVVCSIRDLSFLRQKFSRPFLMICPGIRPKTTRDDQKRTGTAGEAVLLGADFIVVGRPVIESSEPEMVVAQLLGEMEEAENA